VFGREYTGSVDNPRLYAHTIADEVHQNQRGLRGVARTKLTFASDRNGERIVGPVDNRTIKEVYMADYDGGNQRRVTVNRSLNITPVWSADGRAIAYTSYRRGFPDVFVSFIYEGRLETPAAGTPDEQNWLPAWSPDGRRIAFTSNRDGNPELYVIDADGGNLRRLTNNPAIDTSPTWSPTGTQLAFTSDRSGRPQIYVIGVDGTGIRRMTFESYCDRPTWSPAPFNEIAYSSRTGPGHDIKILELATGAVRQLTFGLGTNESPAYAPNGRHLAFTSTRSGGKQIFTMARDGSNLRRVTRAGNNEMANWSH
jgi:TolB protein